MVGATSGIGRETALRFAALGANLALAARSEPAFRRLADERRCAGAREAVECPTDGHLLVGSVPGQVAVPYMSTDYGEPPGHTLRHRH